MRLPFATAVAAAFLTAAACEPAAPGPAAADAAPGTSAGLSVAYVNIDSVLTGYTYLGEQSGILEQRQQDATADLERRARKLQDQFASFQRRAQGGNLTPKQIENEQTVLARSQQELEVEQQRLAYEFQGEGARLQSAFTTALKREVDALQAERGYDFVLSYGGGTAGVLAVNDAYDITPEVVTRMNAGPAPAAADSTAAQ